MNKPFAVFDIDGTLIRWQLYHAIADELARQGHFDTTTFAAVKQARMNWKQRTHVDSYKDYEHQLVTAYRSILTNLEVSQFNQAAAAVFSEYKNQVYTYTRDLIKDLKSKGFLLFAISNSQTEIVQKIAQNYGFDDCVGAEYERKYNHFTGNIKLSLGDKHLVLQKLVKKHNASFKDSMAVGDSESDITMLDSVEHPVAFNPTQRLFAHAKMSGWTVVIERKNVIYSLESHDGKYLLA